MRVLLDSSFLHDGHIGGRSSSLTAFALGSGVWSPLSVTGVDCTDFGGRVLVSKVHLTGIKFLRLYPLDEYTQYGGVGADEGIRTSADVPGSRHGMLSGS